MIKNFRFHLWIIAIFSGLFFGLWQGIFVQHTVIIYQLDTAINAFMGDHHGIPWVNDLFIVLTKLFDPYIFLSWFIALLVLLWFLKKQKAVFFLFLGLAGGQTLKIIIKYLTDRTRPENPFDLSVHESSFPSGHAMTAVFFFLSIGYLFARQGTRKQKALAHASLLLGAMLIPFTRLFVQVHYFSDVLAGMFLGIISFACTVLFFECLGKSYKLKYVQKSD